MKAALFPGVCTPSPFCLHVHLLRGLKRTNFIINSGLAMSPKYVTCHRVLGATNAVCLGQAQFTYAEKSAAPTG